MFTVIHLKSKVSNQKPSKSAFSSQMNSDQAQLNNESTTSTHISSSQSPNSRPLPEGQNCGHRTTTNGFRSSLKQRFSRLLHTYRSRSKANGMVGDKVESPEAVLSSHSSELDVCADPINTCEYYQMMVNSSLSQLELMIKEVDQAIEMRRALGYFPKVEHVQHKADKGQCGYSRDSGMEEYGSKDDDEVVEEDDDDEDDEEEDDQFLLESLQELKQDLLLIVSLRKRSTGTNLHRLKKFWSH